MDFKCFLLVWVFALVSVSSKRTPREKVLDPFLPCTFPVRTFFLGLYLTYSHVQQQGSRNRVGKELDHSFAKRPGKRERSMEVTRDKIFSIPWCVSVQALVRVHGGCSIINRLGEKLAVLLKAAAEPGRGRASVRWKSCMNVEAISRVIAVCYHDNQPLQSPARSAARLHQLGCARGEDCGGLWQPSEWAATVCHASFGQGRAAALNSSADSCHPELVSPE
ncbi:E3 ubiquitin-protein ligase MARCHF3 isoform 4-T28 [Molossus nigricans]